MAQAWAVPVTCDPGGDRCVQLGGGITFHHENGQLYVASNGKHYRRSGRPDSGGIDTMSEVIDARPQSPGMAPTPATWGSLPGDTYGSGSGLHDYYLIALALITLFAVMKVWPKWGVPLGWLVLLGAILSTEPAVNGFNALVKTIQTGRLP